MITETRPLTEITQDALRVLYRELGIVETVRFLTQFTTGFGDYTEERRALYDNMSLDDLIQQIHQTSHSPDPEPPTAA